MPLITTAFISGTEFDQFVFLRRRTSNIRRRRKTNWSDGVDSVLNNCPDNCCFVFFILPLGQHRLVTRHLFAVSGSWPSQKIEFG